VIAQRHKSAASRIKLRTRLYDERITDAFARFEQVERSLDQMEGRVESFDLGRKATLADELAGIEKDARVEEELAELKARLGNGPRPMPAQ
jgi:phage shock protein A